MGKITNPSILKSKKTSVDNINMNVTQVICMDRIGMRDTGLESWQVAGFTSLLGLIHQDSLS